VAQRSGPKMQNARRIDTTPMFDGRNSAHSSEGSSSGHALNTAPHRGDSVSDCSEPFNESGYASQCNIAELLNSGASVSRL
jgi:hypothetical protein